MAPRRFVNQHRTVFEMHKRDNSYSEILAVVGILQSTCSDILERFDGRRDLRDRHSHGRPQILDERGKREVIRVLNDPSNNTATTMGRKLQS
jgi:transposase